MSRQRAIPTVVGLSLLMGGLAAIAAFTGHHRAARSYLTIAVVLLFFAGIAAWRT